MQAEWALVTDAGKDVSKKLKEFLFDAEGNLLIHSLYLISATDASLSCVLSSKNWKPQRIVQDPTKRAFETAGYVGLHNIRSFLPETSTFTGEAMNYENLYGFRQFGWKKKDFADTLASYTKDYLLPERRAFFDDCFGVKDPFVRTTSRAQGGFGTLAHAHQFHTFAGGRVRELLFGRQRQRGHSGRGGWRRGGAHGSGRGRGRAHG